MWGVGLLLSVRRLGMSKVGTSGMSASAMVDYIRTLFTEESGMECGLLYKKVQRKGWIR